MEIRRERNILKNIRLLEIKPVFVHDEEDDTKDFIWFYVKGKMVDYVINMDTLEKKQDILLLLLLLNFGSLLEKMKNTSFYQKFYKRMNMKKFYFKIMNK